MDSLTLAAAQEQKITQKTPFSKFYSEEGAIAVGDGSSSAADDFFVAQSPKMPSDRDAPEEAVERRALQLAIIHARAAQGRVPNTKYSPTDDAAHVGEMSIIDLRQEVRTSTSPQPRHAQSVGICAPPP